ncbi:nucleotidyltransferase family protein [Taibaiella soli]|uniref:Polymerase beta nucleotidyltransferase domain-containing protein n=1 Tax=Taibaiella soli TaxID=1649169 RepID=A0A2W2C2I4_9BACT|nr:nucleotidyltransferase domain-containing protein [Taibaiella soli]PZF74303.1 hypothetical protein DN068_04660 [Taibaiella soli]
MVTEVSQNLDAIIALCQEMQLETLYLFGSAAREADYKAESDLDFLYRFKKDNSGFPLSGYDYFDLLFRLENITGKKVDLVAEEKISNRYFKERILNERIKLYAS